MWRVSSTLSRITLVGELAWSRSIIAAISFVMPAWTVGLTKISPLATRRGSSFLLLNSSNRTLDFFPSARLAFQTMLGSFVKTHPNLLYLQHRDSFSTFLTFFSPLYYFLYSLQCSLCLRFTTVITTTIDLMTILNYYNYFRINWCWPNDVNNLSVCIKKSQIKIIFDLKDNFYNWLSIRILIFIFFYY